MPGRVGKHKEAPLPALPQQQARVDSGLGGSAGTAPTGGLKRRDTLRNEPPPSKPPRQPVAALQATNERAPSALTQKFPFLARLAGTAHEWKPEQRFVLAIGGDDPKILNSAQVKAFDRQVPDGNRFRAEARGEFGQQLGAASLERLDLSSRLDISAHGNNDAVVPDQESAAQLARRLHDSGLREVGVLKIEASKIGERDYLDKLKAELDALGVKVGYLSAPKDFFANFKTYERGTNGRERVFKEIPLLPGKAIGGAFSPETFGLKVLKGNVDIAFPGTRYDLVAPKEAGLQPTAAAHGNVDKPLPSLPVSPKRQAAGAKLGKLLGKAQQKAQTAAQDLAGMTQRVRGEIRENAKEFKEVAKEFSRHLRDGVPASNKELAEIKADLKKDFGDFKAKLKARIVGAPHQEQQPQPQMRPPPQQFAQRPQYQPSSQHSQRPRHAQGPQQVQQAHVHQAPLASSARMSSPTPSSAVQDGTATWVDEKDFKTEMAAFRSNINSMAKGGSKALKNRVKDSNEVMSNHMTGATNFVFKLEGAPVGVMSVFIPDRGGLKITGLVTHPTWKGVAGALVEGAVKRSMAQNRDGLVQLEYLPNPGKKVSPAKLAYEALGFVSEPGSLTMKLDPASRPDKWKQDATGAWKLKKGPPFMVHRG